MFHIEIVGKRVLTRLANFIALASHWQGFGNDCCGLGKRQ